MTTNVDSSVVDPGFREADSGRPPERSSGRRGLGAAGALVMLAAFAMTRFVTADATVASESRATATRTVAPTDAGPGNVAALEAAVASDPTDLRSTQALAIAYVRSAADGDPSFYDLAERALDRADGIVRDDDATLLGRATLALSRHEFATARDLADRVLATNADLDAALVVRFDAAIELGDYAMAANLLDRLTVSEPGLAVYARVSYFRQLNGDLDGAIEAMRAAATAGADAPIDQAEVRALLGDLLWLRGDAEGALAEFDAALADRPALPVAIVGRARALAATGSLQVAIEELERLTQRLPIPAALELLGELHDDAGDRTSAQRAWSTARVGYELQAASGQVVDLEAAIFEANHGNPATALAYAQQAFAARPDNVFAADALAWALHINGDDAGAAELARTATRLGTVERGLRVRSESLLD